MNKILLAIIIFFGLNSILSAQNFNLQNGNFTVDCNTGGVLYDSGGPGGNYGNNENIIMTICPNNPGFGVFATMVQVNIPEPDQLCIYDGDDNSAPLLPGNFAGDCLANNTDLENGAVFQATVGNTSGCLTFEFSSDAVETGNFQFNLQCNARCQSVLSEITASIPDTVMEDGRAYINICLGDTLSLFSDATFPQNNTEYTQSAATSSFIWEWGDNSPDEISQNTEHFYDTPGGYIAKLSVFDVNGCRNFQDQIFRVRVAPIPQFIELEDSILCVGQIDTISALPVGTILNGQIVQGDTVYFIPPVFSGDSLELPDGSGVGYDSDVFITSFDNNAEIVNCGDILEICINMEHSFLGDLEITLTCPNGQSAILKAYPGGGGTYLGNPWDGVDNNNGAGDGLTYCFNSDATTLLVNGPTQPATLTPGNTIVPGDYAPVQPFTNFIGCPINGQWTLNITDNLFIDDGWIFNWELNIHPCMFPDVDSFLMLYDFGYWEDDPSIIGIVEDSNTIIIQPDTIGPWIYNYFTQDQFGCEYSNTYQIYADGLQVEATPSDTSVCNEQEVQLDITITGTPPTCEEDYVISTIPVNMIPGTGTNVSLGDDQMSANIPIPFPFEFYCNTYDRYRISSNGYITFDLVAGGTGCCSGQNLPNTANPNDLIGLYWTDLNPANGGTINHFVSGTAPNRIYVTQFTNVPHFGSTANVTGQIQLYETSNIVEIHCQNCQTDNGIITIGLENQNGTIGHPAPSYNATSLAAINRAWRFIPANSLGGFTFNWTPATGLSATDIPNPIATVSSNQQYIVEAINLNGCAAYDTVNIEIGGNFDYTITPDTTICSGDSLQLLITGGGETFAWSPNDGTLSDTSIANPLAFPLSTTTYNVAIDSAGCTANETVTITVSGVEVTSTSITDESCAGAADGSIEILPAGEQYSIDGGITFVNDNVFSGLAAGDYDILVGNGANCDTSYTVTVIGGDPLLIDSIFTQDASCGSINDGIIEMYLSGGVAPLSYSIDSGATSQVSNIFNNLAGGDYDVLITDDLGCIADTLISLSQPDSIEIDVIDIVDVSCFGDTSGSVDFLASGGTPNFEYSLDNTTFTPTATLGNLVAGDYTVYVRDDNNCIDSLDFSITEPDSLFISNYSIDSILCFGDDDGVIDIEGTGGTLPYNYSIDGGTTSQTPSDFTGLTPGDYELVIEDDNGCLSNLIQDSITEPALLEVNILSTTDILCNEDSTGAIEIEVLGGTTPFTFSWNSGVYITEDLTSIPAGSYDVLVTDENGCTATTDTILTEPTALDLVLVETNNVCFGESLGSIDATLSGGVLPYTYTWSNGATTEDIANLPSGQYVFAGIDANGCEIQDSIDITQPDSLYISDYSISNISCFGENDGSIVIEGLGGTQPYNYSIDNGNTFQTNEEFNGLFPDDYELLIEDDNGCFSNLVLDSISEPDSLIVSILSATDILCNGDATGNINIEVIGGTQPYTFSWNNGDDTQNISDLPAGNYEITVTDDAGCIALADTSITEPDALELSLTPVNVSCPNGGDGSIESEVLGGTPPYQYAWSNGQSTEDISNLTIGTYTLTLTDANDCEIQQSVTLTEPDEMDVSFTTNQPSCFEGNDGSITAQVLSGGIAPFQFTWDANANNQVGETASNLEAGAYIVTVEDANGCIQTASTTMGQPAGLSIDNIQVTNLTCFESNDGSVNVSSTGGTGQVNFEIVQNGVVIASNQNGSFNDNFPAGTYTANVIDANGCEVSENFTINQPAQLELLIDDFNDPSCFGSSDGSITVIAQNGEAPYTFELADGTTPVTGGIFVLGNGIYEITVTDANGCQATVNQTLQNPPPVFVDIVADSTSIEMGEPLNLEAVTENTTGAIVYEWSPEDGLNCTDCQNPTAVLYRSQNIFLTVTDELGCTDDASLFIEVLENLAYFVPNAFTPGNADGTNDDFRVYGKNIQYVEMLIFNRWGEKVFEAASPFVTWDGMFKGELQQPGVYNYFVKITFLNGRSVEDKGSVTLIR